MITEEIKNNMTQTTIVAIATPPGNAGVGILRLSGNNSLSIVNKCFKSQTNLESNPRVAVYGTLSMPSFTDTVIAIFFPNPNSFTGEDVVEIHCHGSMLLSKKIVDSLISYGAKAAESGEFTRRAFLNNKLDLSRAEGLLNLIKSTSESALNASFNQMTGAVYQEIDSLQIAVRSLMAHSLSAIDYPEEDLEEQTKSEMNDGLNKVLKKLTALENSYHQTAVVRDGVKVAIVGLPNEGKSLLFNRLLGQDRAIVTVEAGTTRDTLEESYLYKGIRFVIIDTAGIHNGKGEAEKAGIIRSQQALEGADCLIAVCEVSKDFTLELPKDKPVVFVKNKMDLHGEENKKATFLEISALKNQNIEKVKEAVFEKTAGKVATTGNTLGSARQLSAVLEAKNILSKTVKNLKIQSIDCILSDLQEVSRILGTITGETANDKLIDEIFARFCVGK